MEPINIDKSRMEWIQVLEDAGEVPVLKRLQVRIYNSTHPPPGTKVSAVLAYLNLDGSYVLCPISDPAKTFSPEEKLYGLIAIAKLSAVAEAKYAQLFIQ